MTTEFDQTGFSVVAKFFDDDNDGDDHFQSQAPSRSLSGSGRGRQGVGATASRKHQLAEPMKKILQIGRKRQRDDFDDEDVVASDSYAQDNEEEEEGRTAISRAASVNTAKHSSSCKDGDMPGKKKKKPGKKERRSQQPKPDEAATNSKTPNTGSALPHGNADHSVENNQLGAAKTKRKRKKIRSKQKNICKDKRTNQEKPTHLRVGNGSRYEGRPMTEVTRAKLKLPPRKTTRRHWEASSGDGRRQEHEPETMTLAIDELDAVDLGEPSPAPPVDGNAGPPTEASREGKPRSKKSKKKKRSKYKNLAV